MSQPKIQNKRVTKKCMWLAVLDHKGRRYLGLSPSDSLSLSVCFPLLCFLSYYLSFTFSFFSFFFFLFFSFLLEMQEFCWREFELTPLKRSPANRSACLQNMNEWDFLSLCELPSLPGEPQILQSRAEPCCFCGALSEVLPTDSKGTTGVVLWWYILR